MAWLAALIAIVLMAGCGGSNHTTSNGSRQHAETDSRGGEAEGEADEGQQALLSIPHSDRLAFVQLGVAVGNMRSAAALTEHNFIRPRDTVTLRRLRSNVRSLRPRDRLLRRLRLETLGQLDHAIDSRRNRRTARRSAAATIAGGDRILRGLRAYVRGHPAIGGVVPD